MYKPQQISHKLNTAFGYSHTDKIYKNTIHFYNISLTHI